MDKNRPYWPDGLAASTLRVGQGVTAIAFEPGMLALAPRRADQLGLQPDRLWGGV